MATLSKPRKLTIERRWRSGKWGTVSPVAQIMLKGKWLEAAGFTPGERVHIDVREGQLTLRVA